MSKNRVQDSLNHAQFEELKDLLEEDFTDLLHTYMEDSLARVDDMRQALINGDNRAGFEAAHSLKGATANLGADRLTRYSHEMQEACRANTISQQAPLLKKIHDEVHIVNQDIQRRLDE